MRLFATLQVRLISAFVLVVLVALGVSAAVFVIIRRDEQEERALDRVAAVSPQIFSQFAMLSFRGAPPEAFSRFAEEAAERYDIRVFLVDQGGTVAQDSESRLVGKKLGLPPGGSGPGPLIERVVVGAGPAGGIESLGEGPSERYRPPGAGGVDVRAGPGAPQQPAQRPPPRFASLPYRVWHPGSDSPADGLLLVTADLPAIRLPGPERGQATRASESYSLVLAVPEGTVTRAWLDLLPGLGLAAGIALPAAVVLAILLARYISRPLQQLTVASQHLAAGNFDVDVPRARQDEVGRLSRAFATMAERLGAAHSEMRALVANVSHDLKTPLTSILGFSRALETGAVEPAETQRIGGVIHEEAGRLARRLEDLLLLSELDAGQAVIRRERVDLGRLVESVAARILVPGGPAATLDLAPGTVVTADGAKLERVVENLVDNARKFVPPAGRIVLSVRAAGNPPEQAHVVVANTAPPDLAAEDVPRFFDRFYRRDRNRGGPGGTGLGLPIARDLAVLHGGTLDGELRDGEIVMTVTLPLAAAEQG